MKRSVRKIKNVLNSIGYEREDIFDYWVPKNTVLTEDIFHIDFESIKDYDDPPTQWRSYCYYMDTLFLAIL